MTDQTKKANGTILIEGHNLTRAAGTGIATYANVLGKTIRDLGYDSEILVGTSRGLSQNDPTLTEISFFDADRKANLGQKIGYEWRKLTGCPFSIKPFPLPPFGTVISPAVERLAAFSRVHAVRHLEERELFHFKRFKKPLTLEFSSPPTIFHATRPAPLKVAGCPNLYTVHDIVPLRLPYTTADDKKFHLGMIRELCRRADHIVTVSEFSRRDIIQLTGISEDRITNTYQAVHVPAKIAGRSVEVVANDLAAIFGLDYGEYFLFVGAIEPKKNISRLIDAYSASGSKRPLIIAGGLGWMFDQDLQKIEHERFLSYHFIDGTRIKPARSVQRLSYLPFDHLVSLIRGARAMLFPSVYEGFGLPVLEAMALGTPVMTSNVASLPEIAAEAAILVDPYNIEAMAQAIKKLDHDEDLRSELAQRGIRRSEYFSADMYAQRLGALYKRILGTS